MPVRYNILPDVQYPNFNIAGSFAQGQAMAQNMLRQQVLQKELEQQERLRGVITQPNFNLKDPNAVSQLTGVGALDEAIKVMGAQDESAARRAMQQNYLNEVIVRSKKFNEELPNIRAIARENTAKAGSAELKNMQDSTGLVQDILSRSSEESWEDDKNYLSQLDPSIKFPEKFTPKWNERMMRTAKIFQDVATDTAKEQAKARIPKVVAPTQNMPGMLVGPQGVEKLPQVAPGSTAWGPEPAAPEVRRPNAMTANQPVNNMGRLLPPESMNIPQEAQDIQATMATEQMIQQNAPIGREKEALGKYKFSNTLRSMGNTFIDLAKNKGIAVPGEDPADTFEALANRTKAGQLFGKLDASERVALVDQLKSQVVTAIPQFAAAAGLQSKNFDSEKEGERLMRALADPDNVANISSAFRILNDLNTQFGTGRALFEPKKEIGGIIGARRGAGQKEIDFRMMK